MNYYQHHIGDFNNATRHLTRTERSIYRDLLELYYDTELPLPTDFERLARRCLVDDCDKGAMREVLNEFFELLDDGYHNARADREIEAYQRMAQGGKRGAEKRWGKPADSPPIATPLPPHAEGNANHEPITNNHKPITKNTNTPPEGVSDAVWADFCQHRKNKRSPITKTAMAGIKREADKAGWTLEAAIAECCARGWTGFKAEWVNKDSTSETAYQRSKRQQLERDFPNLMNKPEINHGPAIALG